VSALRKTISLSTQLKNSYPKNERHPGGHLTRHSAQLTRQCCLVRVCLACAYCAANPIPRARTRAYWSENTVHHFQTGTVLFLGVAGGQLLLCQSGGAPGGLSVSRAYCAAKPCDQGGRCFSRARIAAQIPRARARIGRQTHLKNRYPKNEGYPGGSFTAQ
jgi:hypothetical protein